MKSINIRKSSLVKTLGSTDSAGNALDAIDRSPDDRFFKYPEEIGQGSFKTVFRGMDAHTGEHVAWCELGVRSLAFTLKVVILDRKVYNIVVFHG